MKVYTNKIGVIIFSLIRLKTKHKQFMFRDKVQSNSEKGNVDVQSRNHLEMGIINYSQLRYQAQ